MSSAKAIAKAIKAKGLQKLKFYCQVCEKQCRDENGFKCHIASESHVRRMQLFSSNAKQYLESYSRQFEQGFLDILSRRHNTKRINANVVYNEYIQDKEHVHMNATKWTSLTQFCHYLAEIGKVEVDEDDRGIYIQWIEAATKDKLARQAAVSRKRKQEADDEERRQQELRQQMEAAAVLAPAPTMPVPSDISAKEAGDVSISFTSKKQKAKKPKVAVTSGLFDDDEEDLKEGGEVDAKVPEKPIETLKQQQKVTPIATEMVENAWPCVNIVVKVISSKPGGSKNKNKKGVVVRIIKEQQNDGNVQFEIKMLKSGDIVVAKESHLETVIPDLGNDVLIVSRDVSFPNRGQVGKLIDIDIEKYKATVKLSCGVVPNFEYENVCKFKPKLDFDFQ